MTFNIIFWLITSLAEATVIGLLLYRHAWRTFPVFLTYNVWALAGSIIDYTAFRNYHSSYASSYYVITYMAVMIVDSCLLFGVLVELGWSILRPVRASLPRFVPVAIGIIILIVGAIIWPFSSIPMESHMSHALQFLIRLQQTFSVLRVIVFVALAAFSQFLSIGWRDRELQIATGLGFASIVGLAVAMLHDYPALHAQYNHLSEVGVAGFFCSLLYWIVSFSQKEQERREFSPQMEGMLLAVAGAARATRLAIADSKSPIAPDNKK